MRKRRALGWSLFTSLFLGLLLLAVWSIAIEPGRLVVRRQTIAVSGWPPALAGWTVVALSDIHAGSPHMDRDGLRRVVALANEQRADLVVLLGDYVIRVWTREPDVDAALRPVPPGEVVIVLTHNPDVFPNVPPRAPLTLAGHTHGGQVSLPLFGPPIVPSAYGRRYAAGLIEESGRLLFVTPGVGTSIIPVRLLVPPEVSVLTLVPASPPPGA